jgi:hypothetical protein
MYSTIIVECQTKTVNLNCEDCIAHKTCILQEKKDNPLEVTIGPRNNCSAVTEVTIASNSTCLILNGNIG